MLRHCVVDCVVLLYITNETIVKTRNFNRSTKNVSRNHENVSRNVKYNWVLCVPKSELISPHKEE